MCTNTTNRLPSASPIFLVFTVCISLTNFSSGKMLCHSLCNSIFRLCLRPRILLTHNNSHPLPSQIYLLTYPHFSSTPFQYSPPKTPPHPKRFFVKIPNLHKKYFAITINIVDLTTKIIVDERAARN